MEFSAKQIAAFIQGEIIGNENATVHTFAKIEEGTKGAISFLSNPKYEQYIYTTESSIVLVNKDFNPEKEISATLIKVENAYEALAKLLQLYEASKPRPTGISEKASVDPGAKIGENVYIGPFATIMAGAEIQDGVRIYPGCFVGMGARIGKDTTLNANVSVYEGVRIGSRCIIHSGAVIGADGFGFAPGANGYDKIPQIGTVIIEDDVEIGANTCVDRATMGATIVHRGVKLDNLVQIAHNDVVGEHTVMAAQVGIAGSAKIGKWCVFGGQAGSSGHITIGDHAAIGPQAGIISNVKENSRIIGSPTMDEKAFFKSMTVLRKLPDMYKQMYQLQKELEELKKQIDK